jgi:anti-sigma regulatory factor (Ser/Thr protein kinase)
LEIPSDPAALAEVRRTIETYVRQCGFDEDAAGRVVLAVDEALTNVIRHAYEGATDQPIHITLLPLRDGVEVIVRDRGRNVHPSAIRSRDLDEVRPGGLGVHIMNECMDRVEFTPAEGGGTELTMQKRLPPREDESENEKGQQP